MTVSENPEIMGGTACFDGTRVPISWLVKYQGLANVLKDWPWVKKSVEELK